MSVARHQGQRVGVFIDAQNLYHGAKHLFKARVNFNGILDGAVAGRNLIRAIAYVITTESGEEKGFLEALVKLGIEAKSKDLQIFYGGAKKADWDVGLAVDAIKLAGKLDVIVLVSGDGDYVPLIEYLKTNMVQCEVMAFGKNTSSKLREIADHFIDLSEDPEKYLMISRRGKSGHGRRGGRGEMKETEEDQPLETIETPTERKAGPITPED